MPSPVISTIWRYPGARPVSRVQTKAASTGAGTAASVTATLDANATIGNTLIIAFDSGANVTTVKYGSNSFVWINNTHMAFVPVVEASPTIVVSTGSSVRTAVIVAEYRGTIIASDVPMLIATGSSTSNATGTLATTRYANELIIAVMARQGSTASEQTAWLTNPTNSFASVLQTSTSSTNAADRWVALLERFVTATGAYSTAGTQANVAWQNGIVSFVGG